MKWREEAVDASARKAAARLAKAAGPGFYLAGGTALALRLGHRISLDLDLFSRDNRLGRSERSDILRVLRASGPMKILEETDGTCHLRLESTAVSLFHYPYRLLGPARLWTGLRAASIEDIAAMKLSAAAGRGSRKDFVDLYCICRKIGLETAMRAGSRKFPDHADFPLRAARALVYFDDAEKEPLPRLLAPLDWREVKSYFEREVPRFVRAHTATAR